MLYDLQSPFVAMLAGLLGQPVELDPLGRVAFATSDGVTIILEVADEDDDGPLDRFHLMAEVAAPPPGEALNADILALALILNRALVGTHGFALMMGDAIAALPRHLFLCHAAPLSTAVPEVLAPLLSEFSITAAYLKDELNPAT